MRRHQPHQQAHAGAGVAHVDDARGFRQAADTDAYTGATLSVNFRPDFQGETPDALQVSVQLLLSPEDGWLLRECERKLKDIPGIIVHGRYDVVTPMKTAWALHKAWPEAELDIVQDAGHAASEPGIIDALVRATNRFAGP